MPPTVRLLSIPKVVNELLVTVDPRVVEDSTCEPPMKYAPLMLVLPDTSRGYDEDALLPTPVAPNRLLEPLSVVAPDDVSDVADTDCKLAVPDVWVMLPPTVRLLRIPRDVKELLVIPEPNVVDDKTCVPAIK